MFYESLQYMYNTRQKHAIRSDNKRKRKRSDSVLWQKPLHRKKNPKKTTWQHKNATKNIDYTTIADRLRAVSWGNDSHQTGVVKPVYGIQTFPLNL